MIRQRIHALAGSLVVLAGSAALGGCSHFSSTASHAGAYDDVVGWSNGDEPPSGLVFSNGMPPSADGPSPEWYAQRFSRARGIGEAVKQNHRSQWDRDTGTFVYYMGGVLAAHYLPWAHTLRIVTQKKDENNTICEWTQRGTLTVGTADNSPAPADGEETCRRLLDELAKHVAPNSVLSKSEQSPAAP
jgi:hypothetical protein